MATETIERRREGEIVDDAERQDESEPADDGLHLTDLRIQGFRCFDDLTVNRLGRVNLIAGRNGSGKSSFLEAVQVLAERGSRNSIYRILDSRNEFREGVIDSFGPYVMYDHLSLFYGRAPNIETRVIIGGTDHSNEVVISPRTVIDEGERIVEYVTEMFPIGQIKFIEIDCENHIGYVPIMPIFKRQLIQIPIDEGDFGLPIRIATLGPNVPSERLIAQLWENVAITPSEEPAIEALSLIAGRDVADVAVLGGREPESRPITVVRMAGSHERVALRSLGDGAVRAIGYVMALADAAGGIMLIDEVENGIHYTVLSEFWNMILRTAQDYDVQVFATTHSWDCVRGFSEATAENPDVDCAMFRLGETRNSKRLYATEYSMDDLLVAARQGIEVR